MIILTDSATDITPEEAKNYGIEVMPLYVNFGDEEYIPGVNLTATEFYEKLIETNIFPITSQINPARFEEKFKELTADGEEVIYIALSSKLSGTYNSAVNTAKSFGGKVIVVDSENVCVGQRILVLRAMELKNQGLSAKEVAEKLNVEKKQIRLLAVLDTLEYLKKGGRISALTAFAGNLLSIKPVIAVVDGKIAMVGKARGSKNGNNLLREMIKKGNGIDFERPYYLGYTGLTDNFLKKYVADSAELWKDQTDDIPVALVGPVIGTHIGPNAIAVTFFEKQ